ncbi:MAG: hypothetical protein JW703_01675 [Candidatus Diapherotrites archaeon]|nr:hypothetical protein [Candidatus Diapherotrites archaeon]
MKGMFYVKTIEADWKPPFKKNIKEETFNCSEKESFDRITGNGNDETVFTVESVSPDKARVKYSKLFTLKNSLNPTNYVLVMDKGHEHTITYLWGEQGITKLIKFKGTSEFNNEL